MTESNKPMRICGVVVLYYPDMEETVRNIYRYIDYVDHLIIWDNTPAEDSIGHRIVLPEYADKISYMGSGTNEGLSVALNKSLNYASSNGFTHLLTMDQDSYWIEIAGYITFIHKYMDANGNKAIFGPHIIDETYDRYDDTSDYEYAEDYELADYLITSGTIASVDILNQIGGYFKDFKIDGIDLEISLRAKSYGIDLISVNRGVLLQKYGTPERVSFLWKTFLSCGYSHTRLYELVRSFVIISRKYNIPAKLKKIIMYRYIVRYPTRIILGEKNKYIKIKSLITGWIDGLSYKI